ncbi:UDP-glucose dehydrogenase family protein [Arsenicicoccus sp. oral taxon 190]|uniref:UDP-glucose dehydrogenase family protein n=1 Tax=Arsenicicoccus sp. oral taxon 190 TaxID=1658671 RepID=UPI00067A3A98|nr:UDP-glucose/GDP-mannose dehydrogenase family protein [Arsenicicoccus sp. oral taxon 190]AKT50194.1 UDP-glucose 6-dehydrogenase [Arsenicicoccus sp. oral taxon 190]
MKISVIGCGYLGAVHAACMAELGHEVVGVDVDGARVERLARGEAPFYEPGFAEVLARNVGEGRLRFTTDMGEVAGARVHFIGVGTPQRESGLAADLSHLDAAMTDLVAVMAEHPVAGALVVGKSTVPVGTAARLQAWCEDAGVAATVVWNPEFLREGFAVKDTLTPDRVVYGLPEDRVAGEAARDVLDEVYAGVLVHGMPRLLANYQTAELVKVAANSFLATKISFINAIAELCEATGADVTRLAEALGHDERIGPKFLRAGVGFGGGCLPKDIRAFMARAGELGVDQALTFLREVDGINQRRRQHAVALAERHFGGSVRGRRVAILGAAFKPDSDDLRDSPALYVATRLVGQGADVVVTDPIALPGLHARYPHIQTAPDARAACLDAELVMLLTEWREFTTLDPQRLGAIVQDRAVIDGRNALDPQAWEAAGWTYHGMGRASTTW